MEWRHLTEFKQDQYFSRMATNRSIFSTRIQSNIITFNNWNCLGFHVEDTICEMEHDSNLKFNTCKPKKNETKGRISIVISLYRYVMHCRFENTRIYKGMQFDRLKKIAVSDSSQFLVNVIFFFFFKYLI
jgi:hypothetical protein